MSLQSRCNYSVVAARVLWEGEERGRGKEAGDGGVMERVVGRDVTRCACKKNRGGVRQGEGRGCVKDGWGGLTIGRVRKLDRQKKGFSVLVCFLFFFIIQQK